VGLVSVRGEGATFTISIPVEGPNERGTTGS
jgi:hypothetical protein